MRTERKALRRLAVLVAASAAALFMGAIPAYADNGPHVSTATNGTTLDSTGAFTNGVKITDAGQGRCSSCHRAHTAGAAKLLNATSEEALCFSCHGNGGTGATTNVEGGVAYNAASKTTYPDGTTQTVVRGTTLVGALRGGGFEQAMIGTGSATKDIGGYGAHGWESVNRQIPPATAQAPSTSSHLGGTAIMWGNGAYSTTGNAGKAMSTTANTKLECTACHDPHGNRQYRILRPVPTDSGFTAKIGTNTDPGIFIKDTANKVYTTTNYWIAGDPNASDTLTGTYIGATSSSDPTPVAKSNLPRGATVPVQVSSYQANVSAWCTTCHSRYLAASGSYAANTGDSIFAYRHRTDRVDKGESDTPNCTQCHVAHGSNAAMPNSNVTYPGGSTASTDSRLLRVDDRGVCVMCHNV